MSLFDKIARFSVQRVACKKRGKETFWLENCALGLLVSSHGMRMRWFHFTTWTTRLQGLLAGQLMRRPDTAMTASRSTSEARLKGRKNWSKLLKEAVKQTGIHFERQTK